MDRPAGYLVLVLHAHMPFVRQSELEHSAEENWLYENVVHCYAPLARRLSALARDRAPVRVALSLTPTWLEMLGDPLVRRRLVRYLDDRAGLARDQARRVVEDPAVARRLEEWGDRIEDTRRWLVEEHDGDLRRPFRRLVERGEAEILGSAATHAYLPLWRGHPELLELQVELGMRAAQEALGVRPRGFWLPECGYSPALDELLLRMGVRYTFAGALGLLHARPRPPLGVSAPVITPGGLAVFGRDPLTERQVQRREGGYPGDPVYLDPWNDLAYERPPEELEPWTHLPGRPPSGLRYRRGDGSVYEPGLAAERADVHAAHFAGMMGDHVRHLAREHGRPPVVAALFDAELFGHLWHEGSSWLDLLLRKLAFDQDAVRVTSPGEYLAENRRQVVATPSESSWGYQGYSEVWLMGRNHWIYPALSEAAEDLRRVVSRRTERHRDRDAALDHAVRELLLAQSSDWAFLLHARTSEEYARRRVQEHLETFRILLSQVEENRVDRDWLDAVKRKDNLFGSMDLLGPYREALGNS